MFDGYPEQYQNPFDGSYLSISYHGNTENVQQMVFRDCHHKFHRDGAGKPAFIAFEKGGSYEEMGRSFYSHGKCRGRI